MVPPAQGGCLGQLPVWMVHWRWAVLCACWAALPLTCGLLTQCLPGSSRTATATHPGRLILSSDNHCVWNPSALADSAVIVEDKNAGFGMLTKMLMPCDTVDLKLFLHLDCSCIEPAVWVSVATEDGFELDVCQTLTRGHGFPSTSFWYWCDDL